MIGSLKVEGWEKINHANRYLSALLITGKINFTVEKLQGIE